MTSKPAQPAGLGKAGASLWKRLTSKYDFDPWEVIVVESAARQADDVAALERIIKDQGVIVKGSAGQPRLAAVVTEVRQGRLALARLLAELRLPSEDAPDQPMSGRSVRAQRAANVRWARQRRAAGEG